MPLKVCDQFRIRAVVKTDEPKRWKWLQREKDAYQKPSIQNSPVIRSLYDTVNEYKSVEAFEDETAFNAAAEKEPFCLVLEWMDVPLSELDPQKYKNNPTFMAALFQALLEGVRDINNAKTKDGNLVWTGTVTTAYLACVVFLLRRKLVALS